MVYVFLANGFEEVEAMTPIDILRRGKVEVKTVGIGGKVITGSHKIHVITDISTEKIDISKADAVILPGGMPGTLNLEKDETVIKTVKYCFEQHKIIGAICAAPSILGHLGMLRGKKATAYPGFESELQGAFFENGFVEKDDNIITARGMGVSVEFGLTLLAALKSQKVADNVRDSIQCQ